MQLENLRWMETVSSEGEPAAQGNRRKLLIHFDHREGEATHKIEVIIYGYGCGFQEIHIRDRDGQGDYEGLIDGFAHDASFWGKALVWAEPRTIAHLVAEVIFGQ